MWYSPSAPSGEDANFFSIRASRARSAKLVTLGKRTKQIGSDFEATSDEVMVQLVALHEQKQRIETEVDPMTKPIKYLIEALLDRKK